MNQLPQALYTKCSKHELGQHSLTLGDSGLRKKYFFDNPERLIKSCYLREDETVIKVDVYAFAGALPSLKQVEDGIWENNSPLLTQYILEV